MSETTEISTVEKNIINKRDIVLDYIRVFAMALVIVSHCSFSDTAHSFSGECVSMLVFLAGASFGYSSFTWSANHYLTYLKKRFHRLIIPVWEFLILFLIIYFLFFRNYFGFSLGYVVKSFLLTSSGVLFVWVYRIFMICAVTTPLLDRIFHNTPVWKTCGILTLLVLGNDFLTSVFKTVRPDLLSDLLQYAISYTVGYGVIAYLGYLFIKQDKKEKLFIGISFTLIYLISGYALKFASLELYKYPPELYFISFGIGFTALLYLFLLKLNVKQISLVEWCSKNAMNMYLAHIIPYHVLVKIPLNPWIQFIILFFGSYFFVFLYEQIIKQIREKNTLDGEH